MKVSEFVEGIGSKLARALRRDLGQCTLKVEQEESDRLQYAYVCLDDDFLRELKSERLKIPPARLNAFDLLRASLGDPHFRDLYLRPAGAAFYEKALGFDRMTDIKIPERTEA